MNMPEVHHGVGAEHPLCDRFQVILVLLFFIALGLDTFSYFLLGVSTVIVSIISVPVLILPGVVFLIVSLYLIQASHTIVFGDTTHKPRLHTSGVYRWVRHPMYFGILLFCLSFLLFSVSVVSLIVWITFFFFYEKMTTYEENDLIKIFGEEYITYRNHVAKWVPGLRLHAK
jgi:protein-S-isoprenylcysteine O-methyltransferase Ste14